MVSRGRVSRYEARAEFRRRSRSDPWVLAGVLVDHDFWPVRGGIEPIRFRLPDAGLIGWAELRSSILATTEEEAAEIALEVARSRWPGRDRNDVPFGV